MARVRAAGSRLVRCADGPAHRPFTLSPFRGLRFDPATVGRPRHGHLSAVRRARRRDGARPGGREPAQHRPADSVTAVRAALPGGARPAARSGARSRFLRADDEPALYLYEYVVDGTTVRGLIGLVGLRHEDERVILPHEDVMPGPVDDRTVLMRTTETNLEPILLVHEGTDRLRDADRQGAPPATRSRTSSPSTAARTGSGRSPTRRCSPRSPPSWPGPRR